MQAGISVPEFQTIQAADELEFDRDFGGALLTVENLGGAPLVVGTQ